MDEIMKQKVCYVEYYQCFADDEEVLICIPQIHKELPDKAYFEFGKTYFHIETRETHIYMDNHDKLYDYINKKGIGKKLYIVENEDYKNKREPTHAYPLYEACVASHVDTH